VRWGVNSSSGAFANPGAARPGMSAWAEQVFNAAVAHAGYPNG
jgi:hypothetical protein